MIGEDQVAELLRAATADIVVPGAPASELATAGIKRRFRRRVATCLGTATAVAAVAVGVPLVLNSERTAPSVPSTDSTTTPSSSSCVDRVPARVLPRWARAGFSEPNPRAPYVLGDNGNIAAILFAQPLAAPPSPHYNNKILWVARVDAGTLRISATLQGGADKASRVITGGPGPSIVNLPQPGCWHLTLQWGASTDSLDLDYLAP
jgi:hypothetical protein